MSRQGRLDLFQVAAVQVAGVQAARWWREGGHWTLTTDFTE